MVQEILVYIIVGAVILKVLYSLYKSVTVKDKSLCGNCGSCDLKSELKKKGKLVPYYEQRSTGKFRFGADEMQYSPER
ncbi:MAG: FeoB-associated Cys-rich membrane protein [Prolixibacteraceae bacterium]